MTKPKSRAATAATSKPRPKKPAKSSAAPAPRALPPARNGKKARQPSPVIGGKLGEMVVLMKRSGGASIFELMDVTGWQRHSVHGALAGALKKRGFVISSLKEDRGRVYRIADPAAPATTATKAKRN